MMAREIIEIDLDKPSFSEEVIDAWKRDVLRKYPLFPPNVIDEIFESYVQDPSQFAAEVEDYCRNIAPKIEPKDYVSQITVIRAGTKEHSEILSKQKEEQDKQESLDAAKPNVPLLPGASAGAATDVASGKPGSSADEDIREER